MNDENNSIREQYDKFTKNYLFFYYLDTWFSRTSGKSIYRKNAIKYLELSPDSIVLDVACGIGLNFKLIQSFLKNNGKLVGVDISSESLKVAEKNIKKHRWSNIGTVNNSITDYYPGILFDAVLCTFALEIITDYKAAIGNIFKLLKPEGRFAMVGMKRSTKFPV